MEKELPLCLGGKGGVKSSIEVENECCSIVKVEATPAKKEEKPPAKIEKVKFKRSNKTYNIGVEAKAS